MKKPSVIINNISFKDIRIGDIFKSNTKLEFRIVSKDNSSTIGIIFLVTGYERTVPMSDLKRGRVKDKLNPSILGIAFMGDGYFNTSNSSKIYSIWKAMIVRGHCPKYKKSMPTYEDSVVCDEWHNFQKFAKWYTDNYPKDGGKYELDKDTKVFGNKRYSPDTCVFISHNDNIEAALAKEYKLLSPDGIIINIYNMAEFGRKEGLSAAALYGVCNGKRPHHKGWRSVIIDKEEKICKS